MESMLSEHHMLRTPLLDPAAGLSHLTAEERVVLSARSQLFLRAAAAVGGPYSPFNSIYNVAAAASGQQLWNQWASLQSQAGLYQHFTAAGGGGPNSMVAVAAAAAAAAAQQQQPHSGLYQQHPAAVLAGNGFRFSPYLVTPPSQLQFQQQQLLPVGHSPPLSSPDTAGSPDGHRTTPH